MENKSGNRFPKKVACADVETIHKKKIFAAKGHCLQKLEDLAILIQPLFPEKSVDRESQVCRHCYERLASRFIVSSSLEISVSDNETNDTPTFSSQSSSCLPDSGELFTPPENMRIEEFNQELRRQNLDVSPLKQPTTIENQAQPSYAVKKRKQIIESFSDETASKMRKLYDLPSAVEFEVPFACGNCTQWIANLKISLQNCTSTSEKIRLLSILPYNIPKSKILAEIPGVTKYMIEAARRLMDKKGKYHTPDPYNGHRINEDTVRLVHSYYLDDDLDCSRQSSNKNDTINVTENGEKVKKVKRFLTRSISEIYNLFHTNHPEVKIGKSKFYSLRLKWVSPQPSREVCVCIYCANFELLLIALKNLKNSTLPIVDIRSQVLSAVVCSPENQECVFQDCKDCPGKNGITFELLGIPDEERSEEVTYAIWEKADLVKKTTSLDSYLQELKNWTIKASVHLACKRIQQKAIRDEKALVRNSSSHLLLHVDFAENWSVILKDEIQSYHWQNKQISIFSAVCYFGDVTQSFAIVSDDRKHDSAYALMAMDIMIKHIEEEFPDRTINSISVISDGAASQFKNRFQYTELKNSVRPKKWIFSTTGHGKGACDGVGGLVKHLATKHNLSKKHIEAIQEAFSFVETVKKYTSAIKLYLIKAEELRIFRERKEKEWKSVKPIKGIQKMHVWKKEVETGRTFTARTNQHPWVQEATI